MAGMFRMRGSRVLQNEAGEVDRDQVMHSFVGNNREVCFYKTNRKIWLCF